MFCIAKNHPHGSCFDMHLQQCEYCEWYQQGHAKPHYPVPAIRTKTFIFDDQVFTVLNAGDYRCIKLWWKGEGEV